MNHLAERSYQIALGPLDNPSRPSIHIGIEFRDGKHLCHALTEVVLPTQNYQNNLSNQIRLSSVYYEFYPLKEVMSSLTKTTSFQYTFYRYLIV
jgi:hypothetical protein